MRPGMTVWFTGLSSSGKTTICECLYKLLRKHGLLQYTGMVWLDGDVVRRTISADLGFSRADRNENIRRIGEKAREHSAQGDIVLVSAISPYRAQRQLVRQRIEQVGAFLEVWVHAPIEVCINRDLKGIYRKALSGEMTQVTGIDDPYEEPFAPDVECRTDLETVNESAIKVLDTMKREYTVLMQQMEFRDQAAGI